MSGSMNCYIPIVICAYEEGVYNRDTFRKQKGEIFSNNKMFLLYLVELKVLPNIEIENLPNI